MAREKKNQSHKKQLKDKYFLYQSLTKIPDSLKHHIIKHLDDKSIDDICECLYNVVFTDMNLSKQKKQFLRQHIKKTMPNIKQMTNRNVSVSKRRIALSQHGNGIGLILSAILPFLAKLFVPS